MALRRADLCCLVSAAVLLGGCATASGGSRPPSPLLPTREGGAELYLFNVRGWTLLPGNQDVTAGDDLIASLPRGIWQRVFVRPGTHELKVSGRKLTLDIAEGKTYYVVVGYKPERSWASPLAGDPVVIKEISPDEARGLLAEMKPREEK